MNLTPAQLRLLRDVANVPDGLLPTWEYLRKRGHRETTRIRLCSDKFLYGMHGGYGQIILWLGDKGRAALAEAEKRK